MYKTIPEFPKYEINEFGDIRNTTTKSSKYINKNHEKVYYLVQFKKGGKVYTRKIHRLVAELFLEPPSEEVLIESSKVHPYKPVVNHIDGDKTNNHYMNLEWCTMLHNSEEAYNLNLVPPLKGVDNGRAILTEEDVHSICRLFETTKLTVVQVSEMFNISRSQVSKIRANLSWQHIRSQYDIPVKRRNTDK